ncbi:MAG: hypothetical protein ACJAYF_003389 [Arenicella sp.]|jgi:hypothetical protein
MGKAAVVAGTGFKNSNGSDRASIIRNNVREGTIVYLVREPNNEHDPNAVAVYIETSGFFGFGKSKRQIGYIKATRSNVVATKLDSGESIPGKVRSFHAPADKSHPRVSLDLEY